ncbi:Transcriptional regulator Myc-B [Dissostichus eleginoides]|uniref:Transcriptional regulator Myc-B n=1 Tax=Dissostichus eleginoides TaxID=100907 RepID=A0AAD9EUR2_DISEL|nr:Transcriptional regulator Myc-B [Dissostichus eleginoides]
MPPVLPMFRGNYDYDYDTVQPYFLDGQEEEVEDFYGEDIWKKFELLPTPPLSPRRRPSLSDACLNAADHLEAVTELLDDDRDTFLQSFIIQDCMWSSSFSAAHKLEQAVSERLAALRNRRESSTTTSKESNSRGSDSNSRGSDSRGSDSDIKESDIRGSDSRESNNCIDPSEVFPFKPLTEKEAPSEPCLETPPLSSSDSESADAGEDLHARRRTHNVLERNRRNDLKRSFSALREETPAVANNEKAAKVLILKTATEFICELREEEGRLMREEEAQRRRNRKLRHTLHTLRTSP